MERPYKYGVTALRRSGATPEQFIYRHTSLTVPSGMVKILGYSRVQPSNRITITVEIQRRLKIKEGDLVVYLEDPEGNIIIRKGELKPV